jgi:hypothetical protein
MYKLYDSANCTMVDVGECDGMCVEGSMRVYVVVGKRGGGGHGHGV